MDSDKAQLSKTEDQEEKTPSVASSRPPSPPAQVGLRPPSPSTQERHRSPAPSVETAPSLSVPKPSSETARVRSISPARISGSLAAKLMTQDERLELIESTMNEVGLAFEKMPPRSTLLRWEQQLSELWVDFSQCHREITDNWPTGNLNHPYFTSRLLWKATNLKNITMMSLAQLKEKSAHDYHQSQANSISASSSQESKLPKLDLPKFSGSFLEWTNYSDLFKSMVLTQANLSDVQKLQYLKLSLKGEAAQLIAGFPLQGDQLKPAWETLKSNYQDKRRVVSTYLDKAIDLKTCSANNYGELRNAFNVISEGSKAVGTLVAPENMGSVLWAHLLTRILDSSMRQDLAFSLGNSREHPTYEQVEDFVRMKLRAMDAARDDASSSTSKGTTIKGHQQPARPKVTSLQTSAPPPTTGSTKYACDCCQAAHYIASCSAFSTKTPADRRALVIERRLCFNCLGRHSAKACRSTLLCRTCKGKHHTLLHEASLHNVPAPQPQSGSSSAPQ